MKEAVLHQDVVRLVTWLCHHFSGTDVLSQRIVARGLELLEWVALALRGMDQEGSLEAADQCLLCLRTLLKVAQEGGALTEAQALHLAKELDPIGRQLGGWLRRYAQDTNVLHSR